MNCGAVKANADMTLMETCPKCGGVYAQTSAALARQLKGAHEPERSKAKSSMGGFERWCWIATAVGSAFGIIQILIVAFGSMSAPQEAASAAVAIAMAAIPYCFARAIHMTVRG
jgi:hypothetical protein